MGFFIQLAAAEMTANSVSANQQCANTMCFGPYGRVRNTEISSEQQKIGQSMGFIYSTMAGVMFFLTIFVIKILFYSSSAF